MVKDYRVKYALGILIVTFSLLIFDFIIVSFSYEYLEAKFIIFHGKSREDIMRDIIFLEGITIFGFGAVLVGGLSENVGGLYHGGFFRGGAVVRPTERKDLREKQISFGILLMIVGAILTGLSVLLWMVNSS